MACLKIISVDTLHKGDTEDNNNNNNNNNTPIWCEIISTISTADTNQRQQHGTRNTEHAIYTLTETKPLTFTVYILFGVALNCHIN